MENSELLLSAEPKTAHDHSTTAALNKAASSALAAAAACRAWEAGGDGTLVTNTAAAAQLAAGIALEAVVADEPWDRSTEEPAARQARLAYAAWFALIAGTDENGTARDLDCAAGRVSGAAVV